MVAVAELVKHRVVVPATTGSSPVGYPLDLGSSNGRTGGFEPSNGRSIRSPRAKGLTRPTYK